MMNSIFGKATVVLLFCSISLFAQKAENKTLSPYFFVKSSNPDIDLLPLKSTSAEVNIVGVIADVTINQVYKNDGKNTLEAVYTFPASSNAALYAMEMTIGNRKIVARIEEKKKARADYEQAKSEGKRTSLLEQQRPNVFQMNVANIKPGDEIKVTLKYTELLVPESGTYQFVYPTVVGPRYSNQDLATAPASDQFVATPYLKEKEAPSYNFDLKVHLSAGLPIQNIFCPSHKIKVDYEHPDLADIRLDSSEYKGGNRDFILNYQLSGDKIESGLLLYRNGDENFFLWMVQPPKRVVKEDIPPREYIFVVDVSGSMQGYPLDISKKLLRNLVVNLRPTDRFNVLFFSGASGWLSDSSVYATTENVEKAITLIDSHKGYGGTELLPALEKAVAYPRHDESLSRSIVIVTDGYVNVEKQSFDLIRTHNDQANTFAFGIGTSVNRYLIEGLARAGMGEPMIVDNQERAAEQAEKFRNYISNPVLTQIKKDFGKFDVYDVEPITVPDVLAERPVIIMGKYKGDEQGTLSLKGYSGGNKRYKTTLDVSTVKSDERNAAIRYLWARNKIKMLEDYKEAGFDSSLIKQVTNLGLKYNLMTAYTSFVAIDEEQIIDHTGKLVTVKQALPLPQGVSNFAVGFDLAIEGVSEGKSIKYKVPPFYKKAEVVKSSVYSYKDVKILTSLSSKDRISAINYIKVKFLASLKSCFSSSQTKPDVIHVKVSAYGKVINLNLKGTKVSQSMRKCLETQINRFNFSRLNLKQEWEFKIMY
ncbi:MAG: VIT domain-containing protein [Bacteroidota bacterium]|nr:VIT domain-containing protein [Bacteroidota bacterium]